MLNGQTETIGRKWARWAAESNAFCFCCGYAFCLALMDVQALVFCYERQHLQDYVAQECSDKIFAAARIESLYRLTIKKTEASSASVSSNLYIRFLSILSLSDVNIS